MKCNQSIMQVEEFFVAVDNITWFNGYHPGHDEIQLEWDAAAGKYTMNVSEVSGQGQDRTGRGGAAGLGCGGRGAARHVAVWGGPASPAHAPSRASSPTRTCPPCLGPQPGPARERASPAHASPSSLRAMQRAQPNQRHKQACQMELLRQAVEVHGGELGEALNHRPLRLVMGTEDFGMVWRGMQWRLPSFSMCTDEAMTDIPIPE